MRLLLAGLLVFVLLPLSAQAGPREDSRAAISRCDQVTNDRQWLDCVYGAVQPMRARLGLAPAPEFQQRLVPGAASMSAPPRTAAVAPAAPVRHSNAAWLHLKAYNFDKHGMFTVTLEDGSIWRQQEDDVNYAHWKEPPSHYMVSVGGGLFGGGTLEMRNDGNEYQVQRVR
jgi:hypothetical protein